MIIKKKIIIKNGTLGMGGGERVLIDLIKNLNRDKYDITLLIDDNNGENNVFLFDVPKWIKVYFLRPEKLVRKVKYYYEKKKRNIIEKILYNYYLWKNIKISQKNCLKIFEEIKKNKEEIDLFIDFNGNARKYIKNITAKKKILWRHLSMSEYSGNSTKIKRYGKYVRNYDLIVAICNNLKKEIVDLLPELEDKVKVLYNPIDYETIIEKSAVTLELSEKEKKLMAQSYILSVSRLDLGKKDYNTLIKGYKIARDNGLAFKMYIIGDGPGRKYIEKLIEENLLSENIILLGSKKNPYIWMKKAEFFVLSSKEEGFGLVLAEAMGLKKAVISSDCPVGPREILKDGNCGLLFEIGNYQELANCLIKFYTDIKLKRNYEIAGFERIEEFNLRSTISKCEKLFDSIIEEKNEK